MMRAAVITVSDSSFLGQRVDVSGRIVAELLQVHGFHVVSRLVVPDVQGEIEDALCQQCEVASLVVTTGGTGISPRDVTPEATRAVCDRDPGWIRGGDAGRGQETNAICSPEPLGFGHPRPIFDCESARQPGRRQSFAGIGYFDDSTCFKYTRRNSDPRPRKPRGGRKAPGNSSLNQGWIISSEQSHNDRDRS